MFSEASLGWVETQFFNKSFIKIYVKTCAGVGRIDVSIFLVKLSFIVMSLKLRGVSLDLPLKVILATFQDQIPIEI